MTDSKAVGGEVLDEHVQLTLHEICRICGTQSEVIVEMVREGVVEPEEWHSDVWRFSGVSVTRIQTTLRLQRDLDVNLPGAALALDLLEEIQRLKRLIRL